MNILFVCTANKLRSLSAEHIYRNDKRFVVKSAGTAKGAASAISKDILEWADYILVMEKTHRNQIRKDYPAIYANKKIICMYIPDEYDYMDAELEKLIQHKFEYIYSKFIAT